MCFPRPHLIFSLFLQLVVHSLYRTHVLFTLIFKFIQPTHGKRHLHLRKRYTGITQKMLQQNQKRKSHFFCKLLTGKAPSYLCNPFRIKPISSKFNLWSAQGSQFSKLKFYTSTTLSNRASSLTLWKLKS